MKKAGLLLLLIAAITGLIAVLTPPQLSEHEKKAIVRLKDSEGNFFCTGYIVDRRTIITAAHCVIIAEIPGLGAATVGVITVADQDNKDTGIRAIVSASRTRIDQAVLDIVKGSIKGLGILPLEQRGDVIQDFFESFRPKVACGYPYGGAFTCTQFYKAVNHNFFFKAFGFLYPGMSGGPVIDLRSGLVIGLNTAVQEDTIILAPTVSILSNGK